MMDVYEGLVGKQVVAVTIEMLPELGEVPLIEFDNGDVLWVFDGELNEDVE